MIYIPNPYHEAAFNLAQEEYILTQSGIQDKVLFFYVNAPSIIIGRHQNTIDEINEEYVRQNNIQVVRRCSGGGAVYHDLGNLNFSLITPGADKASADFSVMLTPILETLRSLGLNAELSGRNDLTLNGVKFSGNAYYHNRSGSYIHGTLLFDSDLTVLSKALRPRPEKYLSKGVQSVRSRVCCIKDALPGIHDVNELEQAIVRHFAETEPLETRHFTSDDLQGIEIIANNRYRSDRWNYGESPAYNVRATFRQPGGWIDFRAGIQDGFIKSVRFFGDFFCTGEISDLETSLINVEWDHEAIENALRTAGWDKFFPDYSLNDFLMEIMPESPKQ